jgi:hypothetical protein
MRSLNTAIWWNEWLVAVQRIKRMKWMGIGNQLSSTIKRNSMELQRIIAGYTIVPSLHSFNTLLTIAPFHLHMIALWWWYTMCYICMIYIGYMIIVYYVCNKWMTHYDVYLILFVCYFIISSSLSFVFVSSSAHHLTTHICYDPCIYMYRWTPNMMLSCLVQA